LFCIWNVWPPPRTVAIPAGTQKSRRSVSRVLSTPFRALDGHSSGTRLAARLNATNPGGGSKTLPRPCVATWRRPPLFGLAPGGVYPANPVTRVAVRSYRTVSPLPQANALGGLFSVALSLGSPPPAVSRHRVSVEPGLSSTRHKPGSGRPTVWISDPLHPLAVPVNQPPHGRRAPCRSRIGLAAQIFRQKMPLERGHHTLRRHIIPNRRKVIHQIAL
jgi:hypothetical protein